jgi:hypothetical protein
MVVSSYRLGRQRRICVPAVGLVADGDEFCFSLLGVLRGLLMRVQCSSFCLPVSGGQRFLRLLQCLASQSNKEGGLAEALAAGFDGRVLR